MSKIVFHYLVKPTKSGTLTKVFHTKLGEFNRAERISGMDVSVASADTDAQLMEQWGRENPRKPLGERRVFRYLLSFD